MTEYLAENARLRQLARRYAEGQLSQDDYRAARRELIEALESGHVQAETDTSTAPELPLTRDDPPADIAALPENATVFFKTTPPLTPDTEQTASSPELVGGWDSHTRVLAVVLGISLLLAVSALVYVFAL